MDNNTVNDDLEYMNSTIQELLDVFIKDIYTNEEMDKCIFEAEYYKKYHKALVSIKKYIPTKCELSNEIDKYKKNVKKYDNYTRYYIYKNHIDEWSNVGNANWGGWGGVSNRVDKCLKIIMKKFMNYYNLINPVTIVVNMRKHIDNEYNPYEKLTGKSFKIAKKNSMMQEKYWYDYFREYMPDIVEQYQNGNCILDLISKNNKIIFEIKLEEQYIDIIQYNKYNNKFPDYKIFYLIGYEDIYVINPINDKSSHKTYEIKDIFNTKRLSSNDIVAIFSL